MRFKLSVLLIAAAVAFAQPIPKPGNGGGGSPTGAAGGDLSGTYPNPSVTKIGGVTPGGTCSAGNVVTSVSASGVPTCTPAGVIGYAVFSASGGVIGSLTAGGVVSGITRLGTGSFRVAFTSAQSNYGVAITGTDNNSAAIYAYMEGNSFATIQTAANSFNLYTMSCPAGVCNTLMDPAVVTVTIFKIGGA